MADGEIVLTRDKSSGHVHKRIRLGDGLATLEGDNLDDAGQYEVLITLADVDPADLCKRCFPEDAPQ
ncbi:MAG: hypothetical protein KKF88_02415 [Alphaproteobacteria bacterium]|nr:hypothetical protein [Alphaproteobacteria bacterium]